MAKGHDRMRGTEMREQAMVHVNAAEMMELARGHGRKLGTGKMELEKLLEKLARSGQEAPATLPCNDLGNVLEVLVIQLCIDLGNVLEVQVTLLCIDLGGALEAPAILLCIVLCDALEALVTQLWSGCSLAEGVQARLREQLQASWKAVEVILHGDLTARELLEQARAFRGSLWRISSSTSRETLS